MAVAHALSRAWGVNESPPILARRVGRGVRSALGVHGFVQGGFLVEGGKRSPDELSPLVVQMPFPDDWPIVLVCPSKQVGVHGQREHEAFARFAHQPQLQTQTEALCRLVLLGLLPALCEHDLEAFGEALYDFNARSGTMFAPLQGGVYASEFVAAVVRFSRSQGIKGVGQSSWGPTVFAVLGDDASADDFARRVREHFALTPAEVFVTRACNHGAV
jgi:beta-RFAP synthase